MPIYTTFTGNSKWHRRDSRGQRNTAKTLQLASSYHTNLPSAPSQARAQRGLWRLHFFVIKCFILPAQHKGILVGLSVCLSLTCFAAACFQFHSYSAWALMWINHFIKMPTWTGAAWNNKPYYMFQWEEDVQNKRIHVYRSLCFPVPFLIWGHPAMSWAFNYSEPLFIKSTSLEVRLSSGPLCL